MTDVSAELLSAHGAQRHRQHSYSIVILHTHITLLCTHQRKTAADL